MAAPPFSLPHPPSHSPHESTAAWPKIYAIAIAAIGHVICTTSMVAAAPATAVTPSLWLAASLIIDLMSSIVADRMKNLMFKRFSHTTARG